MNGNDDARDLLEAFSDFADDTTGSGYTPSAQRPMRLAVVDPAYTGVGNPLLTFEGESLLSFKPYPWAGLKPHAGERVVVAPIGRGYVITGAVGAVQPQASPVFASSAPVLTASTTNPVLGVGAVTSGRYVQIGKMVIYLWSIAFGSSGVSPGVGTFSISTPVPAVPSQTAGSARIYDSSTGNAQLGIRAAINGGSTFGLQYTTAFGGSLGNVAATAPWAWAANDILDGYLIFEAA